MRTRYGGAAHPTARKLLQLAETLDVAELMLNHCALAERVAWALALSAYELRLSARLAQAVERLVAGSKAGAARLEDLREVEASLRELREVRACASGRSSCAPLGGRWS